MMFVILLLIVHVADIYGFSFLEMKLKTVPLKDDLYSLTAFQPMPYAEKRDISFWADNPRARLLRILPEIVDWGSYYWTINAFLFKDQLGSSFRTDFWMRPLDKYMKAYWGQEINDSSIKPRGVYYRTEFNYPRLTFPTANAAMLKISGVTEDKIQFFSRAEFIASEEKIASQMTSPRYKGDIIFLSPIDNGIDTRSKRPASQSGIDLALNARLHLPYKVLRYDSGNLEVQADNHTGPAWLFYSDVWHPLWRAKVNDKDVPVYPANLAYKAVKLEQGANTVHFYFKSRLVSVFQYFVGFNALLWFMITIFMAAF